MRCRPRNRQWSQPDSRGVITRPKAAALALGLLLPTWGAAAEEPKHRSLADKLTVRVGELSLKPYALLQLDEGGTFNQSRRGGQGTGFNVRRARVGGQGTYGKLFEFDLIYDFGSTPGSTSRFFEADIAYVGLDPLVVRAGIYKWAFTLEYAQSAADTLFLERASIVNILGGLVAGAGRVGGQVGAGGDRWFAAAFWTGGRSGYGANSDQRAVLGRAAGLAVKTGDVVLHLGASGAWLYQPPRNDAGRRTLSFSDQTELQIDQADSSLSSGSIPAGGVAFGGLELGLGWKRLWLQGEWYGASVDRDGAGGDPFFSGWYAQAAYTVFGKPRQWKPKIAAWGSPVPEEGFNPLAGQWGALEVAGRFSAVDLKDAGVRGGRQHVWTAGVSWYPVDPLRVVLQYQHANVDGGRSPRSLNAVAGRIQVSF